MMKFSVDHAKGGAFRGDGLREFFEYRDLGIAEATGGRVGAHVIRAKKALGEAGTRHHHSLEFQMVYVLRGWIKFNYAGVGDVLLEAGDCVHQPPGIEHTELGHSDDIEMLEVTLPANFSTTVDP